MKPAHLAFIGVSVFSLSMMAIMSMVGRSTSTSRTRRNVEADNKTNSIPRRDLVDKSQYLRQKDHPGHRLRGAPAAPTTGIDELLPVSVASKGNDERKLVHVNPKNPRIVGRRSTSSFFSSSVDDDGDHTADQSRHLVTRLRAVEGEGRLLEPRRRRQRTKTDVIADPRRPDGRRQKKRRSNRVQTSVSLLW